jgi:hypothetical protein
LDYHCQLASFDLVCAIVYVRAIELAEAIFEILQGFEFTIEVKANGAFVYVVEELLDALIKPVVWCV